MTDQLDGRDLDRACAEAMGWTHMIPGPDWIMPEVLHWLRPDGSFKGSLPSFSTDPSTQKEKLAWLIPQSESLYKQVVLVAADDEIITRASMLFGRRTISETGTDIDQALARLVCSVAKAKKEQGN